MSGTHADTYMCLPMAYLKSMLFLKPTVAIQEVVVFRFAPNVCRSPPPQDCSPSIPACSWLYVVLMSSRCVMHLRLLLKCRSKFARVVKGVDLRSTAGNCAWVRTPQLTFRGIAWFATLPNDTSEAGALQKQPCDLQLRLLKTSSQTAPRTRPPRQESGILLLKF